MAYKPIAWNPQYKDQVPDLMMKGSDALATGIKDFGKGIGELLGKGEQSKALESGWNAMKETREDLVPLMDRLDDDFHGANLKGKQEIFSQMMAASNRSDTRGDADRNYGLNYMREQNDAGYKNALLAEKQRPRRWADLPGTDFRSSEDGVLAHKSRDPNGRPVRIDPVTGLGYVQDDDGNPVSVGSLLQFDQQDSQADGSLFPPPGGVQAPPGSPTPPSGGLSGGPQPNFNQAQPNFPPLPGEEGGSSPPGQPPQPSFLLPNEGPSDSEEDSLLPGAAQGPPRVSYVDPEFTGPPQLSIQDPNYRPPNAPGAGAPSRPGGGRGSARPLIQRGGAQGQPKIHWAIGDDGQKHPFMMGPDGVLHPVPMEGAAAGGAGGGSGGGLPSYYSKWKNR